MEFEYHELSSKEEDEREREELLYLALQLHCTVKDLQNAIHYGVPAKDLYRPIEK